MNMQNIIFSFLAFLSLLNLHCYNEMSVENKREIIASLYETGLELGTLNPQTKALYIQTLQKHKLILKYIITNERAFFNAGIIKGIIGLWFGLPWLFKSIQPFFIYL